MKSNTSDQEPVESESPDKNFLTGVFEVAGQDLLKFARGKKNRQLRLDALRWFITDESEWLCSFLSICEQLDLDPKYWRRTLFKQYKAKARKWKKKNQTQNI